jgi:hypothetical protein
MSSTTTHSTRSPRRALTWLGTLALVSGAACAAPADGSGDGPDADAIRAGEASFEVVAELHPDPETVVRFTVEPSMGEDDGFAVGVTVLGPDTGAPYERLITEHNATALELFQALAPAGSEPPEALRSAHHDEARAQGRDASVRQLELGELQGLTTFPSAYCDSYSAFQNFVSTVWADQPSSGAREQFTDSNGGDHFLQPNSADAAYLTACNRYSNRVDTKQVLLCSRYRYASSGDTSWSCEAVQLADRNRVFKSWGCESTGNYCKERYFHISAAQPVPNPTDSYLGVVQLHYVF